MFEFLKTYKGKILVNEAELDNDSAITLLDNSDGDFIIKLFPKEEEPIIYADKIKIIVKPSMTKIDNSSLTNFNNQYNNGIPMPLRTMFGEITRETKSMYYANLHGKVVVTARCMKCGRTITNKLSMYFGIGPECGKDLRILTPQTREEYEKYKKTIEDRIEKINWQGWIPKSSVITLEYIDDKA